MEEPEQDHGMTGSGSTVQSLPVGMPGAASATPDELHERLQRQEDQLKKHQQMIEELREQRRSDDERRTSDTKLTEFRAELEKKMEKTMAKMMEKMIEKMMEKMDPMMEKMMVTRTENFPQPLPNGYQGHKETWCEKNCPCVFRKRASEKSPERLVEQSQGV